MREELLAEARRVLHISDVDEEVIEPVLDREGNLSYRLKRALDPSLLECEGVAQLLEEHGLTAVPVGDAFALEASLLPGWSHMAARSRLQDLKHGANVLYRLLSGKLDPPLEAAS